MWPFDKIGAWFQNVALKKAIRSIAGVAVALFLSTKLAIWLKALGIELDQEQLTLALTAIISGVLEWIRTTIKAKLNLKFL